MDHARLEEIRKEVATQLIALNKSLGEFHLELALAGEKALPPQEQVSCYQLIGTVIDVNNAVANKLLHPGLVLVTSRK